MYIYLFMYMNTLTYYIFIYICVYICITYSQRTPTVYTTLNTYCLVVKDKYIMYLMVTVD